MQGDTLPSPLPEAIEIACHRLRMCSCSIHLRLKTPPAHAELCSCKRGGTRSLSCQMLGCAMQSRLGLKPPLFDAGLCCGILCVGLKPPTAMLEHTPKGQAPEQNNLVHTGGMPLERDVCSAFRSQASDLLTLLSAPHNRSSRTPTP